MKGYEKRLLRWAFENPVKAACAAWLAAEIISEIAPVARVPARPDEDEEPGGPAFHELPEAAPVPRVGLRLLPPPRSE